MVSGTTEFIDVTTADVYLEEKWSQEATIARMKKIVIADFFRDPTFEGELKKGQILHIGNITQPTATAKVANTAISYETVTETEVFITINSYYYSAIALEDVVKPMLSMNIADKYRPGLIYALTLQEDSDVAALIDDGGITQTVGTLATGLSYDNLIRADQYLNDADVPQEDRAIFISPAEKANFLKMDQFIHKDYSDLRNGLVGSWLGTYPIIVTTNTNGDNTNGHDSFMGHKECIAHVSQLKPAVRAWWDGDYQCVKMSALTTYGSKLRRATHGVWLKGA
uniref:Putative capsid protein n=1 Tax=viral metagenome TaxID=1070528 RepID=A0A6M3L461_9ZZZZ